MTRCCLTLVVAIAAITVRPSPAPAQTRDQSRQERPPETLVEFEERAVQRMTERQARNSDTDRVRWLLELNRIYPGRCASGQTRADFDQWFTLLADGRTEWRKDSATNRAVSDLFDRVTQRLELGPVPSIRKDEFLQFANSVLRPDRNGAVRIQEQYTEADKMFRILDRDGNGIITDAEFTDRLRAVIKAEPDGGNGFDKDRYRIYFQGRVATTVELISLATRPPPPGAVIRPAGKPAKKQQGLPPWFEKLDTDADGQISLAEWRTDLLPSDLFLVMDLNADELVTPAEYLKFMKQKPEFIPVELRLSAAPRNK